MYETYSYSGHKNVYHTERNIKSLILSKVYISSTICSYTFLGVLKLRNLIFVLAPLLQLSVKTFHLYAVYRCFQSQCINLSALPGHERQNKSIKLSLKKAHKFMRSSI